MQHNDIYKVTPAPRHVHDDATAENYSGLGNMYPMPGGVVGWSWGGFFWTLIWALFNRVPIAFLIVIPGFVAALYCYVRRDYILASTGYMVLWFEFGVLCAQITLGLKGREWAWQNKRWRGLNHFNRVQFWWGLAGALVFIPLASFCVWSFVSSIQKSRAIEIRMGKAYQAGEKVGEFVEQQHRLPRTLEEAGAAGHVPGLVYDPDTARMRLPMDVSSVHGAGVTLIPTFNESGLVDWRCLADVALRAQLKRECPYQGSEDARIFPARILTRNAVNFTDQMVQVVGNYIEVNRKLPKTIADAGVTNPLPEEIARIDVNPGKGQIEVIMAKPPMQGQAYLLIPGYNENNRIVWQCLAHQIDWHYLPPSCRYFANPNYHPPGNKAH